MWAILSTAGRVLRRHWPALLAWYLAGVLVHYVVTQLAGYVGGYSATLGFLILPIAILARLVSYVAMLLVLRDGLRELELIAPSPESPAERRRTFLTALLAGILPFFAVYWAQGLLFEDVSAYSARALSVLTGRSWMAAAEGVAGPVREDTVLEIPLNVWTVAIIVAAFVGRWAWSRWSTSLTGWLSPIAVYFEVVWVFFSVMVIGDLVDRGREWAESRAVVDLAERTWHQVQDAVPPVQWLGDGILWLVGAAGPVLIAPLAWLTIAGVVFGQAMVAERLRVEFGVISRLRGHADAASTPVVRRLRDLGEELGARFRPIARALMLIWRAGPVLVASYALVYVAVETLESYLGLAVTRLVGPNDFLFWAIASPLVLAVPALLTEPVRIAVIAGAYDATLARARRMQPSGQGSTENRTNAPSASGGHTSTQNGPSTSSGSTNGTISS